MTKFIGILLATAAFCAAETPNLSGTWKADLTKTKVMPPAKEYVEIIQQTGSKFSEQIGSVGGRGEQRWTLTFDTEKPTIAYVQGVPTRLTASSEGSVITLKTEIDGHPDNGMNRRYELSGDGQTLTISGTQSMGGREMQFSIVLNKQSDSTSVFLQEPEETAEKHFKNVKSPLKEMPVSQFVDQMRYFTWALGKDCEFCHVKDHFDSDDKEEKRTAREMIKMNLAINKDNFDGKPEVRCYTCHEFRGHPLTRPLFPGEPEHHKPEGSATAKAGN